MLPSNTKAGRMESCRWSQVLTSIQATRTAACLKLPFVAEFDQPRCNWRALNFILATIGLCDMKKNLLAIAVTASLGVMSTAAHAVHVNPDHLGQVMLFPYYTVQDGNATNIHVVNTTEEVKAVKVRFREAQNSWEVLDFNLYLSPKDEWTGAIVRTADGAKLITRDTSCTAPAISAAGVDFRNYQYIDDTNTSLGRTREGYIEMIEMGVVTDTDLAAAATHANGTPADCGAIVDAWRSGGTWVADPTRGMGAPTGGLYGYGTIVNVDAGTDVTYDATALDAFSTAVLHATPGSSLPSLADADPEANIVTALAGTPTVLTLDTGANAHPGLDAVSAVLMKGSIMNDYVVDTTIAAGTDWVVTFPTKHPYTNGANAPEAPFTAAWTGEEPSEACEAIGVSYYDREELSPTTPPSDIDFSPLPPVVVVQGPALCYEANVMTVNDSNVFGSTLSHYNINLEEGFDAGWMALDFTTDANHTLSASANGGTDTVVLRGLPTIGFAAIAFQNGDIGGLLSNYGGLTNHKATVNVAINP